MTSDHYPDAPTAAQETIALAMLATLLACLTLSYLALTHVAAPVTTILTICGATTLLTTGYITPHLIAWWLGRPLPAIMAPTDPDASTA